MRLFHILFLLVLVLAGASFSNTIHKYLTFLPAM
jgi:hypothetical protein